METGRMTDKKSHTVYGRQTVYAVLLAIGFAHLLNDMMQSVIPAVYPLLKEKFGFTFAQIGVITLVLLLIISYIIIHRNITRIKRYKRETADLIEQLKQSVEQNEALIASRKKAVHTITHELRTPLTAITGYAGLMWKDYNTV